MDSLGIQPTAASVGLPVGSRNVRRSRASSKNGSLATSGVFFTVSDACRHHQGRLQRLTLPFPVWYCLKTKGFNGDYTVSDSWRELLGGRAEEQDRIDLASALQPRKGDSPAHSGIPAVKVQLLVPSHNTNCPAITVFSSSQDVAVPGVWYLELPTEGVPVPPLDPVPRTVQSTEGRSPNRR